MLAPNRKLFFLCSFVFFCRFFTQTFPHTWCLKGAVDRMQHYGHSICHFRPMVMMMATMGKRKLLTKHTKVTGRKHTQKMPMVIRVNVNPTEWSNQERLFLQFKVVPVPVSSIPLISKMPKATIIRCLVQMRCSIWSRAKRVACCRMYCNRAEMLACRSMCAAPFAKKNSNKRAHCYSTDAFTLNHGKCTHVACSVTLSVSIFDKMMFLLLP